MANIQGISGSTPQLVGTQITADPALSPVFIYTYRGEKTMLRTYTDNQWIPAGAKVTLDESGPMGVATVTYARNPDVTEDKDTISIRWDVGTDRKDVSLFALPEVVTEAETYTSIALYKTEIETAVRESLSLSVLNFPTGTFPRAHQIWRKLSRGQDSFATTLPTLTRTRTFSTAYAAGARLTSFPAIWTTAGLVSTYAVPAAIQEILPPDPNPVPVGQKWGWMQTDRSTTYTQKTNAVEERYSWAFQAWDTEIYLFAG